VLSGGSGSRLRPLTYTQQKQLIPVANKPILFYVIEDLIAAGVRDIGIIVGPNREKVESTVLDRDWSAKFEFIYQDAPLGLAHAVKISEDFIKREPFVMYLGDNLISSGISDHVSNFIASGAEASILLTKVDHPERFGVAELGSNGEVVRLIEKPKIPPSNLALVGIYLFKCAIFEAVREIKPSWRNELEITDAIQWLLDKGHRVEASLIKGWWKDTGLPEDILKANHLILANLESSMLGEVRAGAHVRGKVRIGEGTVLDKGSIIRGPVNIGSNCLISDALVGPYTSIGDGCEISNAEIVGSIVMEGSKIDAKRTIANSLIGRGVKILENDHKGKTFIVGDNSEIRV